MGAVDGAFKKLGFLAQSWVGVNFEVETITFLAVDIRGRVTSFGRKRLVVNDQDLVQVFGFWDLVFPVHVIFFP